MYDTKTTVSAIEKAQTLTVEIFEAIKGVDSLADPFVVDRSLSRVCELLGSLRVTHEYIANPALGPNAELPR